MAYVSSLRLLFLSTFLLCSFETPFHRRVTGRYKGFRLAFDPATVAIIFPDDTLLGARDSRASVHVSKGRKVRSGGSVS